MITVWLFLFSFDSGLIAEIQIIQTIMMGYWCFKTWKINALTQKMIIKFGTQSTVALQTWKATWLDFDSQKFVSTKKIMRVTKNGDLERFLFSKNKPCLISFCLFFLTLDSIIKIISQFSALYIKGIKDGHPFWMKQSKKNLFFQKRKKYSMRNQNKHLRYIIKSANSLDRRDQQWYMVDGRATNQLPKCIYKL